MPDHFRIERQSAPVELERSVRTAPARLFFGGSFDPPHHGHTLLPARVAAMFGEATQVVYVPAARSPFKSVHPTADEHRLSMLRLALQNHHRWSIWEQELRDAPMNPDRPSYWADTWAIVRQMEMDGINRFLIGADQALSMHQWYRYTEFWRDAVVVLRDQGDSPDAFIAHLRTLGVWSDADIEHWSKQIALVPMIHASSTNIRAALRERAQRTEPIGGLAPQVQAYILEHDLYRENDG